MKKIVSAAIAALLSLSAASAMAANAQQNKMKDCNAQATAKALKGDERKKFMSECLKAAPLPPAPPPPPAAGPLAPKDAMKACAAASKGKAGAEKKQFMSDCLKAKGPANMK